MKKYCLLYLLFFAIAISNSQTINLVRFNNTASYTPNSGVSVIINPTGVFELDNQFVLELSTDGGAFTSPTTLTTLNDFYVPTMNGTLPSSLSTGTYRLRIRSTNPISTVETDIFTVVNGSAIQAPKATTTITPNSNFINFINCTGDLTIFGSLNRSDVATVGNVSNGINAPQRNISICNYDASFNYSINLISKIDVPTFSISSPINIAHNAGTFILPTNLGIGTHLFEIEKRSGSNISVFTIVFLFHGNATSLGNSSSEKICINEDVTFAIDKTISGIGRNYYGSRYKIDFGDGTIKEYTHAQLLGLATLNHAYSAVSCNTPTSSYNIRKDLLNKGLSNICNTYSLNGNGVTKNVNISGPPSANFVLPVKQCINTNIFVDNRTLGGSYGNDGCENLATYFWYYKKPGDSDYTLVPASSPWINAAGDLTIPANMATIAGCWDLKLEAVNPDFCQIVSKASNTIRIETAPIPTFTNVQVSPICIGASVSFTNTSNVLGLPCQDAEYSWTVTPVTGTPASASGYSFVAPTAASTQNANILFTQPGLYSVVLNVTNSCGTFASAARIIEVFGDPTVSFNPSSSTVCSATPTGYTINFNQAGTKPLYGTAQIAPTSYLWTVSGAGVIPADYSYVGGTDANSPFPQINFTSFKTYTITVQVKGNCTGSNQASFTLLLKELPVITNTNLTQLICTGGTTVPINLTSSMSPGTDFNWTVASTNGITGFTTPANGSTIPAAALNNPSNTAGTVTYTVTPSNNGCTGIPINFIITVNPEPLIPNQLVAACSGNAFIAPLINDPPSRILPAGTTFTWTVTNPAGIIGAANQTLPVNSITQTLINTTNTAINVIYTVIASTGTFPNTCSSTFTLTVNVNPRLQITNQTLSTCSGNAFNLNLVNNPPTTVIPLGTTYTWSVTNPIGITGASNQNIPVSAIAQTLLNTTSNPINVTYNIAASFGTGSNVCTTNFILTVTVNPAPSATISGNASVCLNANNTLITFTGLNGVAPYTFIYTINGGSNQTITTASGNTISLTVPTAALETFNYCLLNVVDSNAFTCVTSTTSCVSVTVNPLPTIAAQPTATQSICVGGTLAPLTVAYSGGAGTPTYQWYSNTTNSNAGGAVIAGATNSSYTPTTFNTIGSLYYYATISLSGNSCGSVTSNAAEVVVVADPVISTQPLPTQTHCQSSTPVDLSISVAGGIGTFSYQWFRNTTNNNSGGTLIVGAINNTYTPLTSIVGTLYYYCVVTQSGIGCSVTSGISTVIVVPAPNITAQPQSSSICIGATPAVLNVAFANGTGTPTYQWFSNNANSTIGATAIAGATNAAYNPPGNTLGTLYYYCEITFPFGGCTSVLSSIATVTVNQIPIINNASAIICSSEPYTFISTNTSDVLPTGLQYSWNVLSISPAGTVTGAVNGTSQNQFVQQLVNNSNAISTLVFEVTPISGICSGNKFKITIEVYPKPVVIFNIPNQIICNNSNTQQVTLGTSGLGNITYNWVATIPAGITGAISNGSNTIPVQTLINNTATPLTINYSSTATFNNNGFSCEGNVYLYTITVNPTFTSAGIISNYNGWNISAFGASGGAINLTTNGGSATYTYNWTGPNGFTANTEDLTGLLAGTYSVSISDGYCAPIILTFTLKQPPELLLQPDKNLTINLICFGANTGAVGLLITQESVPPYDYELYNSNGLLVASMINTINLNPQFTGLTAGVYSLRVTDANRSIKTLTGLLVTQPADIIITAATTPITCYNANNASITLTISGGTAPYSAQWSNLATGLSQNNLAAGNYSILITDNKNCTKTIVVNIPEVPVFTINPVVRNVSCFGANDGSINLNLIGGVQPISLTWNDGSTAGLVRNNLKPGTYTVTLVDAKPCAIVRTFIILEPQLLILTATIQNALNCTNVSSGAINLIVSGGTPPFTYLWSNGTTTEDLSAIPNGNYSVVVTDSQACKGTAQYSVNRPQPLRLSVTSTSNVNCATKTIVQNCQAQVSGGVPPFKLNWSSGTVSGLNNEIMSTNQSGLITLTASDAIGCTTTYSTNVIIPVLGKPEFNQNSFAFTTFGIYSIKDPIQFSNTATGDYQSLSWDFGDGTFSTNENPSHTYASVGNYIVKQAVTYPSGCVYVYTITLSVGKGYIMVMPTAFTPDNDAINDTYRPVIKGLKNIRLDIFDTWGSLIYFEAGNNLKGWDGTIKGVASENGNYNCVISAETFYGDIVKTTATFVLIK